MMKCRATTRKGPRCSREAPGEGVLTGRCTQHRRILEKGIKKAVKGKGINDLAGISAFPDPGLKDYYMRTKK